MENQISNQKLKNSLPTLTQEHSDTEKKEIASALAACMSTQRTYGKQANELSVTVKTFCMVLSEYSAVDIVDAIKYWLRSKQEFPTPADIHRLITGEVELDSRIYSRLVSTMRTGQHLSTDEWNYIKAYETEGGL